MIVAVEDFRRLVDTDIADDALRIRLQGIEMAIRQYCNNHFNVRGTERKAEIRGGKIILPSSFYLVGDTIEILSPEYEGKVFTVIDKDSEGLKVDGDIRFDGEVTIVLVQYPEDVVTGAVNLLKWDISNRDKIGVKSESISRWSITYYDLETSSLLGYPTSLLGFTKNYMRARF